MLQVRNRLVDNEHRGLKAGRVKSDGVIAVHVQNLQKRHTSKIRSQQAYDKQTTPPASTNPQL